jgi:hypothetical protein
MDEKYLSKKKVEEILKELGNRKGISNYNFLVAKSEDEDIVGNVSACTDCDDESGSEGGAGNVSACADDACS